MNIDRAALDELVAGILAVIDGNVSSIVLYGSVARGTATGESDVDIALIIQRALSAEEEDRLNDFIVDMNLKYNVVFSVIDITAADLKKWVSVVPFYKNVSNEGIVLWKTA